MHCTQRKVSCLGIANMHCVLTIGPVAQRLELTTHNRSVPGSNPGRPIRVRIARSLAFAFLMGWDRGYAAATSLF